MQFSKNEDIYRVSRITGSQDNFLGVALADSPTQLEIVEWAISENPKTRTSSDELLKQVSEGLAEINKELDSNYYLSRIYYLPDERPDNDIYKLLVIELIRRIHSGEIA